MRKLQMKMPTKRTSLSGQCAKPEKREISVSTLNSTAFDAGRKAGAEWFSQNGLSLCVYRDTHREQLASQALINRQEFDKGFAEGVADFIRGVNHG